MSDQHSPNSSPVNILVVEDNRNNLKYLSDILTEAGYRVRPAESGELGLRSAQAKAPDLILLDIKLPGVNGIEVCRQLKSDPETRDVPIIFISALNERGPKVSALEAGGNDYVTKPVEPELLLDRIHTHLHLQQLQHTLINKNIELLAEFEVRKQTEKEVAEKESRYRSLFESSADALSIIDPETGRFVDCNEAAVRLHDAGTRDNFIGTSPDRLSPEYQPGGELSSKLTMQHIQRALGESVARFEWMYSKSDGSLFPAQITLCPIEGKGRKHILAIGRDITERKKLEDKLWLRAQEAEKARQAMLYMLEDVNESAGIVERIKNEWVQIFDAVSDPIFSHDANFHIVRANRAYAECAGMDVEDVIGKPYWEVFPKGDGPMSGCLHAIEKAEAAEEEEEEEIRLENGQVFLNRTYAMREQGPPPPLFHSFNGEYH
jgi:PAS domain S-box-containing protein